MAVIPMGQFDQARVVPRTTPSRVDNSASELEGRAYERLGNTLQGVAQAGLQAQEHKRAREDAENRALTAAKAANATAEYELTVGAAATDHVNRLEAGQLDVGRAGLEWQETVAKLKPPAAPDGMDPALNERFQGAVSQIQTRARLNVEGNVEKARRAAIQREAEQSFDLNAKLAAMPGRSVEEAVARNNAMVSQLRLAGFDEARSHAIVDRANEGLYTTEAVGRINAADGDEAALGAVLADLTGEDGRYLDKFDPDKRLSLQATVQGKLDQLQQRKRVAADKIEARAATAIEAMRAQAVSGYPPKPEDMVGWQQAVAGSTQADAYNGAIELMQEVQDVLKLAPAQQEVYVAEAERKMRTEGASVKDQTRFKTLTSAIEATQKRMATEPLLYLQGITGQAPAPLDFASMAQGGDLGGFGATIADRMDTLKAGRQHYGAQLAMRPLLPQEAKLFVSTMDSMPVEKLNGLFGSIRAAVGSDDAYRAVMQQIAPDAELKAHAGLLAVKPGGEKVSALILRGEALLDAKNGAIKWKMPPDKAFAETFAESVGGAYQGRPQDYQRDLAAVRAVYAGSAARDGNSEAGVELDAKLLQHSIRAVVGEPAKFGGVTVLPPWGVRADDFEDRAEPLMDAALKGAGLERTRGVSLLATPREGVYILAQGRTPLFDPNRTNRKGGPAALVIDFNAETPIPPRKRSVTTGTPTLARDR